MNGNNNNNNNNNISVVNLISDDDSSVVNLISGDDSSNAVETFFYPLNKNSNKRVIVTNDNIDSLINDINKTIRQVNELKQNLLDQQFKLGEKIFIIKKWVKQTGKKWCEFCADKFPKNQSQYYSQGHVDRFISFFRTFL
eukprot:330424_1